MVEGKNPHKSSGLGEEDEKRQSGDTVAPAEATNQITFTWIYDWRHPPSTPPRTPPPALISAPNSTKKARLKSHFQVFVFVKSAIKSQ